MKFNKIACYKDGKLIKISDCSRNMAQWLINKKLTKTTNIENLSRIIRNFSKENKFYYNLLFIRIEIEQDISGDESNLVILKENKVLAIFSTSKECAKWLLEENYIENTTEETIARNIRKAIKNNKLYHNFKFQKLF